MSAALSDEIEVLRSIYGIEAVSTTGPGTANVSSFDRAQNHQTVTYHHDDGLFTASFFIPNDYPMTSSPIFELSFCSSKSDLTSIDQHEIALQVEDYFNSNIGSEVLYQAIEIIRSAILSRDNLNSEYPNLPSGYDDLHDNLDDVLASNEEQSQLLSCFKLPQSPPQEDTDVIVIHGDITIDRKSSFQAHFAVVASMDDVRKFREIVLSDKRVCISFISYNITKHKLH